MTQRKSYLRSLTRVFYDLQQIRIQLGNRVSASERGASDMTTTDEKKLAEYCEDVHTIEVKKLYREIKSIVEAHPIWDAFLRDVRGCGPTMSAVLISEIDIHKAENVSKLWRYAGYGVTDGVGDRRRRGVKSNHNPFLKTKLFVLGGSFLKCSNEAYSAIYANAKNRYENRACSIPLEKHYKDAKSARKTSVDAWKTSRKVNKKRAEEIVEQCNCTPSHVHNKALRYMIKIFLADLYDAWRDAEGLPKRSPYSEEKLEMVHSS